MAPGVRAMSAKLRLAVLVSHPIQYFVPLFRLLARRQDIDFIVLYHNRLGTVPYRDEGFGRDVQWDIPLLEGYCHRFLSHRIEGGGCQWGVVRELLRERPHVLIVHGYSSATNLVGMLLGRIIGIRVLMRGDTRTHQGRVSIFRRLAKRGILSLCHGAIAIGSENRDYYLSLSMNEERVFFAPFSVDNAAFSLPDDARFAARANLRRELGVPPDALIVLFAAKLVRLKRASDLICAFAQVCDRIPAANLVIVGSGDQEESLRRQASETVQGRVHFLGFRNQAALPRIYAAADLFVLPSDNESWGLVVNEAMASGLPVVVSDDVGAAPDLVANTGAGFVYPCGDIGALATCLEKLLNDPALRKSMGSSAREVIASWDVACTADALASVAHKVVGDELVRREGHGS